MSDGYRAQPLDPSSEAESHGELLGWYDTTMHAAMWLMRASVKPDEAAMLLCRIDPLERDWQGYPPDPERIYVDDDKAWPDRYRLLLRVFLDVAETDPKSRTLLDWRGVAKREGLRCHEWVDEYVQAQIEKMPVDACSAANVGADKTAPTDGDIKVDKVILDNAAWPKDVWVREAWEVGTKWMLAEEVKNKERPGIVAVAKHVAAEFKRRDIRSKRLDDYLDWETIKKELTGITEREQGENFKRTMGKPHRKKRSPNAKSQ